MISLFSERRLSKTTRRKTAVYLSAVLLAAAAAVCCRAGYLYLRYRHFQAGDPALSNAARPAKTYPTADGNLYVSTTGDDRNDGS